MRSTPNRTIVAVLAALLGAACGPAPYTIGPVTMEGDPPSPPAPAPPPPVTIVVIPPATARTEEPRVQAPAPSPGDGWIPDLLPRFNPFMEKRTWVGDYDCPQGRTSLTLRVVDVRGTRVRAIFDFHHAPSDVSGQFLMAGQFDEHTGDTVLTPGAWIIHPADYVTVPMVGRVSRDGTRFAGRIPVPGCGEFRLRAVQ